jgi:hypothetical protein
LGKLVEIWHVFVFLLESWFIALQAWIAAHALPLTLALVLAGACGAATYRYRAAMLWLAARIVVRTAPDAKLPVLALHQLDRVARALGCRRLASETADEYCGRLRGLHPELAADLALLRRAFNAARYGSRKPNAEQSKRIVQAFHAVGAALVRVRR